MITRKNDRRIDRTRQALKKALYDLLKEKSYDQLTVEEITERANIGRTTFYLHYKDKEDLLLEDFVELVDHLVEQAASMPLFHLSAGSNLIDQKSNRPRPILMVFQHAAANSDLYRLVLHGQVVNKVSERLREIAIKAVHDLGKARLSEANPNFTLKVPLEVIANYYAGSILGLVSWWLENDMPYSSEQMAQYFQSLFFPGLYQVCGYESNQQSSDG